MTGSELKREGGELNGVRSLVESGISDDFAESFNTHTGMFNKAVS